MKPRLLGPVDAALIEATLEHGQQLVTGQLCEVVTSPNLDIPTAEQVVQYLDRLPNDYLARLVIKAGLGLENPETRNIFAEQLGQLATRNKYDAYALLYDVALQPVPPDPADDPVFIGLRAIKRDSPAEAVEYIVEKGTREFKVKRKPEAQERLETVKQRFQAALALLDQS